MDRPRILVLGKLPPPVMGPALATEIILNSDLKNEFELHHFDTRINESVADMGKLKPGKIKIIRNQYSAFKSMLKTVTPHLVLIPIGQTTAGFFKDVPFIRMAHKSGAKVVIQLRGSAWRRWFNKLDPFRQMGVKRQLNKVSGAIVLGDNLRYIFSDIIPEEKIFVVPNGGDYTFPERADNTHIQLTYLANYLPGKGIQEVLRAMRNLSQKRDLPPYMLNGYGSWDSESYRAQCEDIAKNLPNVTLHTSVSGDAKWKVLADSDIFVFAPMLPEGHPWSIVEALAAGLPVVSTDRGAIAQSVKDGENGFLLTDPDPEIIAEKLEALIRDNDLRKRMGEKSRQMYLSDFTADSMIRNLGKVFNQILQDSCVE